MKSLLVFASILFLSICAYCTEVYKCYIPAFNCVGQVQDSTMDRNSFKISRVNRNLSGCSAADSDYLFTSRMFFKNGTAGYQNHWFMTENAENPNPNQIDIGMVAENGTHMMVNATRDEETGLFLGEIKDDLWRTYSGDITCSEVK